MRGWLAPLLAVLPASALACALPPSILLTLPTGHYIAGAALSVALTGLIGAHAHRLPRMEARMLGRHRRMLPAGLFPFAGFLLFLLLIWIGFTGPADPMHNLLTLIFWSGVWVALPLASMLFGNLWGGISPWIAPVRILRTLLNRQGSAGLSRLGHLPAVAGLFGFFWFELISLAPEDPPTLARAMLIYWLIILAAAVAGGEEWLEKGEFLTVYLGFLSKVAPFWRAGDRIAAGWPGTQILGLPPLPPTAIAFVTLALAGLSFDGLSGTFFWLGLIGQNPLEFTGRSAVQGVNTLGLTAAWALTASAILGAYALGRRLAGQQGARLAGIGPAMLAFLAIAAGYHAAHYLTVLLTTGQYAVYALNDPLFRGDAFLGLPPFYISFGFLADRTAVSLIWAFQFAAILSDVLAVIIALKIAAREGDARALAHMPMTALMVGYTILGLWLLSSPQGA